MAPYLATPTFFGREADLPITGGATLGEDNTMGMDDRNVEEPRPWRFGAPYYRCDQPGGHGSKEPLSELQYIPRRVVRRLSKIAVTHHINMIT